MTSLIQHNQSGASYSLTRTSSGMPNWKNKILYLIYLYLFTVAPVGAGGESSVLIQTPAEQPGTSWNIRWWVFSVVMLSLLEVSSFQLIYAHVHLILPKQFHLSLAFSNEVLYVLTLPLSVNERKKTYWTGVVSKDRIV